MNLILLFTTIASSALAEPTRRILVLSGGGEPVSNHYSQYLQTREAVRDLRSRKLGPVDVCFAAGHRPGVPAALADVHRKVWHFDGTETRFEIGEIEENHPATKSSVLQYFKGLSRKPADHFFLLVSDHGSPNDPEGETDGRYSNNCIDLWNARADRGEVRDLGRFRDKGCLSETELGRLLANVPAQRRVFAMSQCYSGGFHRMSVTIQDGYPTADARVCGFTSTTAEATASGCSPDVDGPTYQGYERSFTEQLTGMDFVRGIRLRPPRASFVEAHEAAMLEDLTTDLPLATSDYYLWQWARAIVDSYFLPRTGGDLTAARLAFIEAADGKRRLKDPRFLARAELFAQMGARIATRYPDLRSDLALPIEELGERVEALDLESRRIDDEYQALDQKANDLYAALDFERWLQSWKAQATPALYSEEWETERWLRARASSVDAFERDRLPILWGEDPERAAEVARFLDDRDRILPDPEPDPVSGFRATSVRQRISTIDSLLPPLDQELERLALRAGLLRRMWVYRQTLGAWAALEALGDQTALGELYALLDCEHTPLHD